MRKTIILLAYIAIPLVAFSQNAIITKDNRVLSVNLLEVNDTALIYKTKVGKKTVYESIAVKDVYGYSLNEGVTFKITSPKTDTIVSLTRDTIVSYVVDNSNIETMLQYSDNQRKALADALKTSGTVTLSVGVPCLAAGIGCLLYANLLPSATEGFTTSKAAAAESENLTYITVEEYIRKMEGYNGKVQFASTAGYILTPLGGALTLTAARTCPGRRWGICRRACQG